MRGMIGGILAGGLVSAIGLGAASVIGEQPAGVTPPEAPLVEAPEVVDPVETAVESRTSDPSTPVGSISIQEPVTPALPEGEAAVVDPVAPQPVEQDAQAPRADTDPLDEPNVVAIEGTMEAPAAPESADMVGEPVDPVLPNPQSMAPQTPVTETDLTVSTAPAQPSVVVDPEDAPEADETAQADTEGATPEGEPEVEQEPAQEPEDFFVVDLGADASGDDAAQDGSDDAMAGDVDVEDAATDMSEDTVLALDEDEPAPRLQLQGGENSLLADRDTGVTIRRPATEVETPETESDGATVDAETNALAAYAADAGDAGSKPQLAIVLIDDGTMSAASAALAGLPFAVTIALDPGMDGAAELMQTYRAAGFEIAVLAKLPEGALPTDVEVTFESVFRTLPETIAVLDIGTGGLQADREVTAQAMEILAAQGRGFITASQGLNMAGRAAETAGVPAAVVYRDLDADGQDARVVRRFVDQAAFRARQESGVVLVGRVRPDTISALILWGTANQNDQVAIVPVSAVLNAQ